MRAAPPGLDLRELVDSLRETLANLGSPRSRSESGDPRGSVLRALAAGPGHGFEIIQMLARQSDPSATAGAVYPVLRQLEEEGLATSEQVGERRVYALTPAGRDAAAATPADGPRDAPAPGERRPDLGWGLDLDGSLPRAAVKLAAVAAQVARDGTTEQRERAAALLDETRKGLYSLLGED